MFAKFSDKQKIFIGATVVIGLLFHYFITGTKEIKHLVKQLEKGTSEERVLAATELGRLGSTRAGTVKALGRAIRDGDAQVRAASIDALVQIDRQAAVESLTNAFDDRDTAVRIDAAEALERIGSPRATEALENAQNHSQQVYERSRLKDFTAEVLRDYQKEQRNRLPREYRDSYDE